MKLSKWAVPILLRLLSLAGLTSGGAVTVGFALASSAQPRPSDVSLDLNFFVQVANQELTVPIMPLWVQFTCFMIIFYVV
jgi:hypothetical protein